MVNPQPVLAVKVENGYVKVYDALKGTFLTTLTSGATSAVSQGSTVVVTMPNGRVKIYDGVKGTFLRSL